MRINPKITPEEVEKLSKALSFEEEKLIEKPKVKLEEVPQEIKEEIYKRAKSVVTPDKPRETITLELRDIRKYALENNLSLKVESYNPAVSEQNLLAEQGKFEAIMNATTLASEEKAVDGQPGETRLLTFQPSVTVPTRAGGSVTLGLPYTRTDIRTSQYSSESHLTGLDIAVAQPLLRNGGFKFNHASIEIAELLLHQADSRMKLAAMRLLAIAEQTYWRYYASHENLKIQLEQYELAEEQVRLARRLVEEGVRTKVEVTRAERGVARQFESILIAENLRRQTERELKRLINLPDLPLDSETIILPATAPRYEGLFFDREKVARLAYSNRMELFENELQQAVDRVLVFMNKNAVLPDLIFTFKYSFSGNQPKFSEALDQVFRDEFNKYDIGLVAELPLEGNRSARARLREAMLSQKQTLATRAVLEQTIHQEVLDAVDSVEENWQRILTNRTAMVLAAETYEAEIIEFQHGFVTSTDVLIALTDLGSAQLAFIQSISDYQNALVDLAFATGTVLGAGGVIWTPERLPE